MRGAEPIGCPISAATAPTAPRPTALSRLGGATLTRSSSHPARCASTLDQRPSSTSLRKPRRRAVYAAIDMPWAKLGGCRRDPESPHADHDGYVPFGKLVNYAAGRTDGCPSWSPSDTETVIAMAKDDPTTLYIYPESRDIDAVARAVEAGQSPSRAGLYWNAACLKEIGSPNFWPRETLEPILGGYREEHSAPRPRPAPICTQP
jgi:hypothetical protein